MSISTPLPPVPPAQPKKSGLGCLGCGCAILALLVILVVSLVGGGIYMGYEALAKLTTTTPAEIPVFDGGDTAFRSAQQKLSDFNHDLKNHQAATMLLSADEINTILANNPEIKSRNIHVFVTLSGSTGRIQASCPTDAIPQLHGALAGHYVNPDVTFEVAFDPVTKSFVFEFTTLRVGPATLIGDGGADDASGYSKGFMRGFAQSFGPAFNQSFNDAIRKTPDGAAFLNQAKSVEIKDGQLVIQTQ